MPKTAVISVRIDPAIKNTAEQVFQKLGLTPSQAITLFYKQIVLQHGLPFSVRISNQETREALDDAVSHRNLKTAETPQASFDDPELIEHVT